jgi:formamidopyrimidine-DNA glycosylase
VPELPEVETVANGVHTRIAGETVLDATFSGLAPTFLTPPHILGPALIGARIEGVRRVGKHIVCDLTPPAGEPTQFLVHLGMTGRLLVSQPEVPRPPHTHAALALSSGRELRFIDPRRFGRLALHTAGPFTGPGSEPLTISPDEFARLFRGRKLAIKPALLHQGLLHGVGNIYADESLHLARIRPSTPAGRISRPRLDRLHGALQSVLRQAIALGGSSVSDYVDAEGHRGFFQLQHRVYARTGLPCSTCSTPIRRVVLGGRSTHYCPRCQR